MNIDPTELSLPSVSPQGIQALDIVNSNDPDIKRLQQVILHDPMLANMLLRHANSPLYHRNQTISNVPAAIRVLGLKSIRSAIVMATMQVVAKPDPVNQPIWDHCLAISLMSRLLAESIDHNIGDDVEFIALIHDMGMLVLASNFPEQYKEIMDTAKKNDTAIDVLEEEAFGIQHGAVMQHLLKQFRLPNDFIRLLTDFHSHKPVPAIETDAQRFSDILSLAHLMVQEQQTEETKMVYQETIIEPSPQLSDKLNVDDTKRDEIIEKYRKRINAQ